MRKFTFTLYRSKRDRRGQPRELSWSEWISEFFSVHELRGGPELKTADKDTLDEIKDGPALVLGVIREGLSHKKENVERVDALSLDIETSTDDGVLVILDTIKDYTYAAYTTYKHGADIAEGIPRLRIVLPLAEPIEGKNFLAAWLRLNAFVGGVNDPSTKDASRLNFLPATFDLSLAEAWHNEGARLLHVDELPLAVVPAPAKAPAIMGDAPRREIVDRLRRRSAQLSVDIYGEMVNAVKAMFRGDSIAAPGDRHNALRDITWWISQKERDLDDTTLDLLFGASLAVMMKEDPSWEGEREVRKLYNDAVSKRNSAATGGEELTPYTSEEVARIASVQGFTKAELERRWVIQSYNSYYFLKENGYYGVPALGRDEGRTKANQVLKRAPVLLNEPSEKGFRRRVVTEIVEEHGWVADRTVVDLVEPGSWYDNDANTMHEVVAPLRVTEPKEDPQIAEWLRLLAGPDHHERFLDWLAAFPDLSRLTAGLYVKGKKGAGKGLLCTGLARFWTTGSYTSFKSVIGNFNESIATCPLVVADEHIPKRVGEDPTAILRQLTGDVEHEFTKKFRSATSMHGALRVILAANNGELLRGNVVSADDQEAMTERFIILEATKAAADYLSSLGGFSYLDQRWRAQDGIAKHVLHLAMTRTVVGDRFATAGIETATHREAFTSNFGQLVREWLCNYCAMPQRAEQHPEIKKLIKVGNGDFLINGEAVKAGWRMYLGLETREEPKLTAIGRALAVMAGKNSRVQRTVDGKRVQFYQIDPKHLIEFAREHMVGSEDSIVTTVNRVAST